MQQAEDFRAESRALAQLLVQADDRDFGRVTQFKGWTVADVIGHLHLFNCAAQKAVEDDQAFADFMLPIMADMAAGKTLLECQYPWLNGLCGRSLFEVWQAGSEDCADAYTKVDPKQRVQWVGPSMSALSSITARQMETWAHGQEVFDLFGVERQEHDRIRNIAHLGVATFGWSFQNRGDAVPETPPRVALTGPSGEEWAWGDEDSSECIRGTAVDFARVVTQVRNIGDTGLTVSGPVATRWMEIAQCFAGPAEVPPAAGTRFRNPNRIS